jgi:hypothetical protein
MTTFKLKADPTFKQKVGIPSHGDLGPVEIEFTFKHRTKSELDEFLATIDAAVEKGGYLGIESDINYVQQVASGWELTDEFNQENIRLLLENYMGAAGAISNVYLTTLYQVKVGNFEGRRARS